jgi:beta-lactam-binding protein with PASTA domain
MNGFMRGIGLFLALIAVGLASAVLVVALLLRQEEVRVPDLSGQDIVAVIEMLNQQGLQLKVERRASSPDLPRDAVISQSPAAGSSIKKGRQVRVVVSIGPSDTETPKLIGEHFRKADIMIRQAGYLPGPLSRTSSDTVDRDLVIGQDPPPGSPIDRGGKISLLISSGKKQEKLVMPKLMGKTLEQALIAVDRMGLQHVVQYKSGREKTDGAERTVIGQKPAAGWPIDPDATVEIVVAK